MNVLKYDQIKFHNLLKSAMESQTVGCTTFCLQKKQTSLAYFTFEL